MRITGSQSTQRKDDHPSRLIFLISLPRSGSTLLQRVLSTHENIYTTAEPWLMLHPLHALKKKALSAKYDHSLAVSALSDVIGQIPEGEDIYFQAVRSYGLVFYDRLLELSGKRLFLDKTPRYYTIIPELFKTFPDARFIILLRNPLAILSSVLQTWCNNDPDILKPTSNYRDLIEGPKALIDGIKTLGDRATVVNYENLVANPMSCVGEICNYLDIPFHEEMLEYGSRKAPEGTFGDTVGINKHRRPVAHSTNKWIANFTNVKRRTFATDYAYGVGASTFQQLGYDFSAIESVFNDLFERGHRSSEIVTEAETTTTFLLSSQNTVRNQYEQLLASLQHVETETIVAEIKAFLAVHPEYPKAHNDLGVLYGTMNLPEQALTHYRKAVSLNGRNVTFQKNLADFLFIVRNDIQGALKIYTRLLTYNPNDTETLYAIGQVSLHVGKKEDALTFFERIIAISPKHASAIQALETMRLNAPGIESEQSFGGDSSKKRGRPALKQPARHTALQAQPISEDISLKNDILVATSIAPHDIDNQKAAVQSWLDLGFDVVSLNSPEEINALKDHFPTVAFHAVTRNGQDLFGKPYVFFDDFTTYFQSVDRAVYGIINSDIHLKANPAIYQFLKHETVGSLVFGSRLDIDSLDKRRGDFYRNGFDFFFFDKSVLTLYPPSIVSIGVTWWDYWAALIPALKGIPIKKIVSPFAYHIIHPTRWDAKQWNKVGRHVSDYLKTEDLDKDQGRLSNSPWAIFLEMLENCAAVKCMEKQIQDITRRRIAYGDNFSLNICILDFIDRVSIDTLLPWDNISNCEAYRTKGTNFFPNLFNTPGDNNSSETSPRLLQDASCRFKRAYDFYQNNNLEEAESILKAITTSLPGFPPASNLFAVMLWGQGYHDAALTYFNAALRYDPYDRPTIINCAKAMIHLGKSEEAWHLYAAYLRFNPGDIEIGRFLQALESNQLSDLPVNFALHRKQDLPELPLLIYQMGKVGSTSLIDSIDQNDIATRHVHTLSWAGIEHAEKLLLQEENGSLPAWFRPYRGIRTEIDRLGIKGHWNIITLVRDPLKRYVSELFQNIDRFFPGIQASENYDTSEIVEHIYNYLDNFNEQRDFACTWFDREVKEVFDIDVFATPFDTQRGYQQYHNEVADILLIRLEDLSRCASEALGTFLSIPSFTLVNANVANKKPYADLYKRVLSELVIDRKLLDRFYKNRLATHFYSKAEIEGFKDQWTAPDSTMPLSEPTDTFRASAIVSTYASENFIEGRLQNLVDQTLFKRGELEIIVVDSNSPEQERKVVEKFADQYPNITYCRTAERETVYAAWNRGIEMARGTYFVNANTDDRFTPDALETFTDILDTQTEYDAVYGDWAVTRTPNDSFESGTHKRLFSYPEFHPGLFFYLQITSHATFVRRSVFEKIGPFDGSYTVFGDREFMFRFSAGGHRALKIDKTVGLYLENPNSVERANKDIGLKECAALYRHYLAPDKFAALLGYDHPALNVKLSQAYTQVGCYGMGLYRIEGKKYHALGSPTQLFSKAIEQDPTNAHALNNMGVIAQYRNATGDALRFFREAQKHADNKQAGTINHNQNLTHRKISDPDKLLFLFPSDFQPIYVSESAYSPGQPDAIYKNQKPRELKPTIQSKQKNRPVTDKNRDIENAKLKPAWTDYLKEDYSAAMLALEQVLADAPEYWEAYELQVDIMMQCGQGAAIPEQLRPLENHPGLPARMLSLIGSGYEAAGDLSQAQHFADLALNEDADCARGWNLKGVLAYHQKDLEAAGDCFQKAADLDAQWGEPWTNLGNIQWEQGFHDKAFTCFEKGFQLSPTALNVMTTYHIAVSEMERFEHAKPIFETVVAAHPGFRNARFLLIDILICTGSFRKALIQIEDVLVRFGADSQFLGAAKAIRAKTGPMTIKAVKRPSLSLCMIVKNEERYLARSLKSLKPIVDEMIIVDTGSNDSTRDIANVFGAKVFDFEWNDDFAAARNYSLEKASGDWILVMDADEVIAAKDHKNFQKRLKKAHLNRQAFMVVTRNYTDQYNIIGWQANGGKYSNEEKGTGWIPSEKVRLFPNDQDIRFEYPIHEVVGPALARKNIHVKSFPYPVHHYGKMDRNVNRNKDEHYYKIGMDKLSTSPNDPVAIRELAIQAAKLDKNEDSITLWKRFIKLQPDDPRPYINLASCHGKLKQYRKAREAAQKATQLAPDVKEAHLNLGLSELHLGNTSKAEKIFLKLVVKDPNYHAALFLLGAVQLCDGHFEKGGQTLMRLRDLTIWDNLTYSVQELVESLIAANWPELALNLVNGAKSLNCSNETIKADDSQLKMKATG